MWKVTDLFAPQATSPIPQKTLSSGFSIPAYGIGTWHIGGSWQQGPQSEDSPDIWAIRDAVDKEGVTHLDTAEVYGQGNTERLIGQALKGRDRSKLFIASKVSDEHFGYDQVIAACKASIDRLMTEYLDLYLVHKFNAAVPLDETMRAMEFLKDEGLIQNIGVSNFGVEHLKEAQSYTRHPIVCDQVHYNLEYRQPEREGLLEYCQQNDVMLVAYRAVQKGAFSEHPPEILKEMSEKYGKTPSQIALNWLISQLNVVAIAKTKHIDHLKENLASLDWEMDAEDVERLRAEYPDQKDVSNSVPLG
jgi:diketogulonate reductase-like aldo/keto reductase